MKRKITIRKLLIPLLAPFKTSKFVEKSRETVFLELESDGIRAFSESPGLSLPILYPENTDMIVYVLKKYLADYALKAKSIGDFKSKSNWVKGNNLALYACESLLYDFFAKQKRISLAKMLNGNKTKILGQVSFGIAPYPALCGKIDAAIGQGFDQIKIKIDKKNNFKLLKKLKDNYPDLSFSADANSAFSEKDFALLQSLDRFELKMLEQPFSGEDLVLHAKLQKQIETPICLDESIPGKYAAKQAIELGACKIINVKPPRVGGISNSIEISELASENGVQCWIGGLLETSVGRAFNIAVASTKHFSLSNDINSPSRYLAGDIATGLVFSGKNVIVPNSPGIGVKIDYEAIDRYTVQKEEFVYG